MPSRNDAMQFHRIPIIKNQFLPCVIILKTQGGIVTPFVNSLDSTARKWPRIKIFHDEGSGCFAAIQFVRAGLGIVLRAKFGEP